VQPVAHRAGLREAGVAVAQGLERVGEAAAEALAQRLQPGRVPPDGGGLQPAVELPPDRGQRRDHDLVRRRLERRDDGARRLLETGARVGREGVVLAQEIVGADRQHRRARPHGKAQAPQEVGVDRGGRTADAAVDDLPSARALGGRLQLGLRVAGQEHVLGRRRVEMDLHGDQPVLRVEARIELRGVQAPAEGTAGPRQGEPGRA